MNRKQIISTGLLCLLLAWPQGPLSRCCCQAFGSTVDVSGTTDGQPCCHQKTGIDPANAGCPQCCCSDPTSKLAIKTTTGSHGLPLAPGSSYSYLRPRAERLSPVRWDPAPQALGHQQRQATLSVWLK